MRSSSAVSRCARADALRLVTAWQWSLRIAAAIDVGCCESDDARAALGALEAPPPASTRGAPCDAWKVRRSHSTPNRSRSGTALNQGENPDPMLRVLADRVLLQAVLRLERLVLDGRASLSAADAGSALRAYAPEHALARAHARAALNTRAILRTAAEGCWDQSLGGPPLRRGGLFRALRARDLAAEAGHTIPVHPPLRACLRGAISLRRWRGWPGRAITSVAWSSQASALEHRRACAIASATELQATLSPVPHSPVTTLTPPCPPRSGARFVPSGGCAALRRFASHSVQAASLAMLHATDRTSAAQHSRAAAEAVRAADDETLPAPLRSALLCAAARLHELEAAAASDAPPALADGVGAQVLSDSAKGPLAAEAVAAMRVSDLREWLDKLGVPIGQTETSDPL